MVFAQLRSGAHISHRPEFLSGLIFTTTQLVLITATIAFIFKTSYVKKFNVLACETNREQTSCVSSRDKKHNCN